MLSLFACPHLSVLFSFPLSSVSPPLSLFPLKRTYLHQGHLSAGSEASGQLLHVQPLQQAHGGLPPLQHTALPCIVSVTAICVSGFLCCEYSSVARVPVLPDFQGSRLQLSRLDVFCSQFAVASGRHCSSWPASGVSNSLFPSLFPFFEKTKILYASVNCFLASVCLFHGISTSHSFPAVAPSVCRAKLTCSDMTDFCNFGFFFGGNVCDMEPCSARSSGGPVGWQFYILSKLSKTGPVLFHRGLHPMQTFKFIEYLLEY